MKTTFYLIQIVAICLLMGCRRGGSSINDTEKTGNSIDTTNITTMLPPSDKKPTINLYIENSGSMDGYVTGQTAFKGAIRDLLVMLKYYYDETNIKIFFINSDIHSTASEIDLATFAQNINTLWYVGDRKHSKLNNIFKMVLARTDNQTISILFSDYIYSISGKNTAGLLNDAKSLTKDAFLSKWKKDKVPLATTIVKLESKFKGKYFPYTGDQYNFPIDMERPYYICVIGNQEILNDFNQKIALDSGKIEGFENKYMLSSEDLKGIYWSVLNSSFNNGRFKPDRELSSKNYTHGIKDARLNRSGENFTFAIAVDFSKIQAEDSYICNIANYKVTTDNFTVTEVSPIEQKKKEITASDWLTIQEDKPTHIIMLKGNSKQIANVAFLLKKQIPQWVYQSDTEDDTTAEKLKDTTFGLKYWVEGIAEAYEEIHKDNQNYFECSISIK